MPPDAQLGIELVSHRLDELHFMREGQPDPGGPARPVDIQVQLSVSEPEGESLSVRVGLRMKDPSVMSIDAAYIVVLRMTDQFLFEGSVEEEWKKIASRLAPVILYPFLRETIASTLQKAGLEVPMTPILDFRRVFDPDQIRFESESASF